MGLSEAEQERMQTDEPLIQIALFPGIVACRRGGFESSPCSSSHADDVSSSPLQLQHEGETVGFRSRRLMQGWVFCRWGRTRVWEGGKPADDVEVHGEQWEGGTVESYLGVAGVVDPKGKGR